MALKATCSSTREPTRFYSPSTSGKYSPRTHGCQEVGVEHRLRGAQSQPRRAPPGPPQAHLAAEALCCPLLAGSDTPAPAQGAQIPRGPSLSSSLPHPLQVYIQRLELALLCFTFLEFFLLSSTAITVCREGHRSAEVRPWGTASPPETGGDMRLGGWGRRGCG